MFTMTISERMQVGPPNEHQTAINFANGGATRSAAGLAEDAQSALTALYSTTSPGSGLGPERAIGVTGKGGVPYVVELISEGGGINRVKIRTPRMDGVNLAFTTMPSKPFQAVGIRVESR
jgi:hypothetical protein